VKKIAVICPSRSRPNNIKEVISSFYDCKSSLSDIYFVIDSDDTSNYEKYTSNIGIIKYEKNNDSRGVVAPMNYGASKLSKQYEYLYFMGDDHRFRTKDWDNIFVENMNAMDNIGIIYPNDLLQGSMLASSHLISSNIVKILGHFYNPIFTHLCSDNSIMSIGHGLNRIKYLENVVIEHLHPFSGKSQWDDLYRTVNSENMNKKDREAWHNWSQNIYPHEIEKLKKELKI